MPRRGIVATLMESDARSQGVAAGRALLDQALLELRLAEDPALSVRDAKGALGDAMAELYHAEDERGSWEDFSARVQTAVGSVREALSILQETASDDLAVHRCIEACGLALGRLLDASLPPLDAPMPLPRTSAIARATFGEPMLLTYARPAIRPEVPFNTELPPAAFVPAPLEGWPTDIDTLIALAEASIDIDPSQADEPEEPDGGTPPSGGGPASDGDADAERASSAPPPPAPPMDDAREVLFGVAIPETELLRARAEALLVDLASMGRMRYPQDDLPWLHGESTENRLLCRIDALVAAGVEVFPHLVAMVGDRPVPDPELAWALILLHGCLDGADALDEIARLLATLALDDPEVAGAVANALMLSPHPGIASLVRPWLSLPESRAGFAVDRRRIATLVLGHRREMSLDEILAATRDADDDVALHAARALELFEGRVANEDLARITRHKRPLVARAGIFAAMVHRRELGVRRAIEITMGDAPDTSDAAMVVAIGASRDEAERVLLDAARRKDDPFVLRALGWHGSVAAIEHLLTMVASEEHGIPNAAAASLERITQALLFAEGPLPEHAPGDEPFKRPWAPAITMPEPCLDAKRWDEWWQRHRREAHHGTRYRGGHAWSPRDNLHALEDRATTLSDRRWAWLELCVRTGASIPIDPHRFAVHQLALVERWRAHVGRSLGKIPDGTWPVRYEG